MSIYGTAGVHTIPSLPPLPPSSHIYQYSYHAHTRKRRVKLVRLGTLGFSYGKLTFGWDGMSRLDDCFSLLYKGVKDLYKLTHT